MSKKTVIMDKPLPIKVEKGLPIPTKTYAATKWAFLGTLAKGDSFWVETFREARSIYNVARKRGIKVTQRAVKENGKQGFRVWLV